MQVTVRGSPITSVASDSSESSCEGENPFRLNPCGSFRDGENMMNRAEQGWIHGELAFVQPLHQIFPQKQRRVPANVIVNGQKQLGLLHCCSAERCSGREVS
jgi:hypothetical protein